ncbi:biotin-independent malonate decarboxylase subunit beta [Acidicapsa acidisoli]|uniref:biotin-independent malonate decarboxylase subunit beta n=1 Tax=Acidicapsa acidisoli TaxID=1615681 RepID=UPI0021E0A25B|nr:biotin-independent malonate decarboxylase subunit beta [Acidicapsa acidisoli]
MSTAENFPAFVNRKSFIELDGRARARSLFDEGTAKELVGPFDRVQSPWLPIQGVAPQADDGCIVIKGKIGGLPAVVVSLEGAFQGGSIGEVSGAKMTAALDLATKDSETGTKTAAVLLLETGGVRLQEANLGLAAIAEVISSILALRRHAPVITVVAGTVGCFGGMSLAAGVSSYVIMTKEARLGLNGPEVIEQESGIDEFDASDRALIWAIHGGEQRVGIGEADELVEDDAGRIASAIRSYVQAGPPSEYRSEQVKLNRDRIATLDMSKQIDPISLRKKWNGNDTTGGAR